MGLTHQFLWGALWMATWTAALFFVRFWTQSRDRLFLMFGLAFAMLGTHWLALALVNPGEETRHYLYVLRLVAYLLIIAGIVDKNRRGPGAGA